VLAALAEKGDIAAPQDVVLPGESGDAPALPEPPRGAADDDLA
jgi:hypothetical protein